MDGLDAFGGDEDAALRYAIALSLQDTGNSSSKNPIEIESDGDDDLDKGPKYPSVAKKTENQQGHHESQSVPLPEMSSIPQQSTPKNPSSFTTLGLDRKKMEEERLARLGKRKAPDSEPESQNRRQRQKLDTESTVTANPAKSELHLPYPKGIVKKTWAKGFPRKDDIKIEEVLQEDELELAVISSFQWDERWMLSKIDYRKTKIVCIAFATNEAQQEEMKANIPPGTAIKFCFPPMMPSGNMHSKLQLLKYPRYLRVVVPSGNLVPYDWGETGVIENMVFLIDLPRLGDPGSRLSSKLGLFGEELCYFLRAQGLEESLVSSLKNYDFSEADRYRFVHTIGGSHVDDKWKQTGYCGLGRAVTSLGLNTTEDIEIDFLASSLGSLKMDLISAIYYSAQGDDGMKEYGIRNAQGRKSKAPMQAKPDLKNKFRIYFPSCETVVQSRGGKNAAGTICVQSKWWDSATFPRELIHDCKSVRSGLLIHSKLMLVRHSNSGKSKAAFAYVGSANLSESAWGRLAKERGTSNPKLTCRNWECGVIVPISPQDPSENGSRPSSVSDFNSTIPVPMNIPGEAYGDIKSKPPWLFLEN
ncbi:Tyrosyl-DNA phosphodiesterase 1 [Daldinia childiae]|uniref:Tyrosyl-DNA phosphodiesterase 1 n=1 Tax=Daldinia childiae TaxID=326645 RepID=UPI001447358A|nr:Tyrosyl-DNA phosphodiesterase 1 [Daldinia childiae]KAF3059935.1 Tyrosyl-DNA phosphodiesterase 1 [Daldinia childiae]